MKMFSSQKEGEEEILNASFLRQFLAQEGKNEILKMTIFSAFSQCIIKHFYIHHTYLEDK
jgi:hypothetical protein